MKILEEESRRLLVPTYIQKITIDEADVRELNTKSHDVVLSVHVYKELDIIQSAGVEVRGLQTNAITQYKCPTKPVLEKYVFTPNVEPAHCTEGLHTHSSGEHECHPCEGGGAAQSRHHTSVTSCESHHCGHATYKSKCNNV
ncbi:hypothetical protein L798_14046 [Zootermopsis nevadensis]|uniref:Uncharacterized protein n=1 Tax=Zootermopsis nevadensis TaxID=136037 RepID=A0A067QRN6_ZOONE|nr:hypothetical protein L798_14046 [Zootermopsis nevadensis]